MAETVTGSNNGVSKEYLQNNLRVLRKKLNLSQEELSAQAGLNRGNIASYENGSAEPRICSLLKFSDIFGVPVLDLLQHDLSDTSKYVLASKNYQLRNGVGLADFEEFLAQSEEFSRVLEGTNTCFQYRMKSLGEDVSRESLVLAHKFEELHELAAQILSSHRELLKMVSRHFQEDHAHLP